MTGPLTRYLEYVEERLPPAHRKLVQGDLYLTVVDWYTVGVAPEEAAARIRSAIGGEASP